MNRQTEQPEPFWQKKAFRHIALLFTIVGFTFMFLSENGFAVIVIGGTALLLAHVVAFTGLSILGGRWLAQRFGSGNSQKQEVE